MKKIYLKIILCLFIFIPSFSLISASSLNDFDLFLSKKIYNDCKDQKINLRSNSTLGILLVEYFNIEKITPDLEFISIEPKQTNINTVIEWISRYKPYATYINYPENPQLYEGLNKLGYKSTQGKEFSFYSDGLNIFNCGGKNMDINGTQYFWDKELIELPKIENYYDNNYTLFGLNIIQNGGITIFGITILSFSIVGGLTFLSIGSLLIPFIRKKFIVIIKRKVN
ncbi:hypothetical protein KKH36_01565 [Patescibacteria group bacterium]|nr:hypothetical protein [Patescibacteria group bacterium]